jgi:hypothetical protein
VPIGRAARMVSWRPHRFEADSSEAPANCQDRFHDEETRAEQADLAGGRGHAPRWPTRPQLEYRTQRIGS